MKRLRTSVLEQSSVEIKNEAVWYLPVTTYEIQFQKVKRTKMDILIKMMLLTFEETDIRRAANLSELLLVEELFIDDLIEKLQRTGLIRVEKGVYKLTVKGHNQLRNGIVEEELDDEWTELIYSTNHLECWPETVEVVTSIEEKLSLYRYAKEDDEATLKADDILPVLAERENGFDEEGLQLVVSEIKSIDKQQVELIPCIEFQLYNGEQDIYFARVWNLALESWDDTLEKQIEENELGKWREQWGTGLR